MRYMDKIIFVKKSESHYDPEFGEWVEGTPIKTSTIANVTDVGVDRSTAIFGDVKQGAKVIRTQPFFSLPEFDYIEYDDRTWEQVTIRHPVYRYSLIVEEVTIDEQTKSKS
ncbi:hypothetical protein [Melissococcus plutonius]|uniref:hypothetical protein n=1 Tax=Melissococcus plutonius TaxID=33970 RepID=UPI003C2FA5BA